MWLGRRVYFLSDRNGPVTLFSYDTVTKRVTEVLRNEGADIKSAGPGAIIYEQVGALPLFDLESGQTRKLAIRVSNDLRLASLARQSPRRA